MKITAILALVSVTAVAEGKTSNLQTFLSKAEYERQMVRSELVHKGLSSHVKIARHVALHSARSLQRSAPSETSNTDDASDVDVFIGTAGEGHTFPGAQVPFGMIQATPYLRVPKVGAVDQQSGYNNRFKQAVFHGIAHSSLSGAGSGELGELRVGPTAPDGYKVHHDHIQASPGYFSTSLFPPSVSNWYSLLGLGKKQPTKPNKVEVTTTDRAAVHRFTWGQGAPRTVRVAFGPVKGNYFGIELANYHFNKVSDRRIEGCSQNLDVGFGAALLEMCFVIEAQQDLVSITPESNRVSGGRLQNQFVDLQFADDADLSVLHISVSRTNVEGARKNMVELEGKTFEQVVESARGRWDASLGAIEVDMDPDMKVEFYTAMYHSMVAPSLSSDVDGQFRLQKSRDGEKPPTHLPYSAVGWEGEELEENVPVGHVRSEQKAQYSSMSLWDTYRATHPLLNLIRPKESSDFAASLEQMAASYGSLPLWPLGAAPSDMMIGDPGAVTLATMALQGRTDVASTFKLLNRTRRLTYDERKFLVEDKYMGVMPYTLTQVVSRALEQAVADSCTARLADTLRLPTEAQYFWHRAAYYRKYWDQTQRVFTPVTKYGHRQEFSLTEGSKDYTEGTALQYSFFVPFDVQGMIKLRGGDSRFVQDLNYFFEEVPSPKKDENMASSLHGCTIGNEPSHHTAYLYDYVPGAAAKTQEVAHTLMTKFYSSKDNGLPGNEDMGQMSSWLVWSMLGMYPVDPCSSQYALGRPMVKTAKVHVPDGVLSIQVHDQAKDNMFVQKASFNGQPLTAPFLDFQQVHQGGSLEFWMGSSPGPEGGYAAAQQ